MSAKLGCQVDRNIDLVARVLGAGPGNNLATLTLRAEVLQVILRLKPEQNFLIHPKKLVTDTARRLIIKEQNLKIKNSFIEALDDQDD